MFEIGNSLREARARRQVDFNEAELATKIRVKYLRALEEERFEQLPSPTYVKGFLRTYAEYLGLDGQLYVDEFNSRFVSGEESDRARGARRSSVRPERRTRRLETTIVVLVVAVVGIVTLVVTAAWQSGGSSGTTPKAPAKTHVVKKHAVTHRAVPFLQIEALNGASYVAVHRTNASGRLLFQGTIDKGRTEPFNGKYFWVSVSSPENLRVIVGGKRVSLHGGKPVVLTVTPHGVQTS